MLPHLSDPPTIGIVAFADAEVLVVDDRPGPSACAGQIRCLVDRDGRLPATGGREYDMLVTTRPGAPAPWVSIAPARLDAQLAALRRNVAASPIAAMMLLRTLRLGETLGFDAALELESLAYSTLLGGGEFARWLARRGPAEAVPACPQQVRYDRDGAGVTLTLASPDTRNAMTAAMRDALCEMLANVIEDPSLPQLVLRGAGRCFSTGGYLPEFGTARDLARAHAVRMLRSPARLLNILDERAEVRLHGACIGSGIELAAAAARRLAAPDTVFQLPELAMGLIPGAGGTVTIPRAIGRQRAAWVMLSGLRFGTAQALEWGLIDAIDT